MPEYLEKLWSCKHDIPSNSQEFSVWQFDSHDGSTKMTLDLGMHVLNKSGTLTMSLYCPFWMLNKTGLMLGYRVSNALYLISYILILYTTYRYWELKSNLLFTL